MFVFGLACLALFTVISILLGNESPRDADPRIEIARWTLYGIR
jgi:hypothetical protein